MKNIVEKLEDLCIDKLFIVSYELLKRRLVDQFRCYMKDIIFAERPSQKLLKKILLHDCNILHCFAPFLSSLSNITLDSLKFENLEFLRQFNLSSFSCKSMKSIDIEAFLNNFNKKTRIKMRYLRLRKIGINNEPLVLLPQFVNVKFLDLSQTSLETESLRQICDSMKFIVGINIAATKVNDLSPLRCLAHQLEFLDVHDLPNEALTQVFIVIKYMEKLRHLDLSVMHPVKTDLGGETALLSWKCLSSLRLLDLSGQQYNVTSYLIVNAIRRMPRLKYFIYNPDSSPHIVTDNHKLKQFFKHSSQLTVVGGFSKQTMLNSLVYSLENRRYLTTSLHQLFDKTKNAQFVNDILNATILTHMSRIGPGKHDWLVAITAVLYNLTKGRFAEHWTVSQLSNVMTLLIGFLETSDDFQQLTVNIFLIVCSDYIIQTATFDKLRLAQLVFRGLGKYDAENISQAGVIIISVIASELTKSELNLLVSDVNNFRILLSLVCRRCVFQDDLDNISANSYLSDLRQNLRSSGEPLFDFTLKFTLSSLWNLTDECTVACKQFVEQQGLFIYFVMIEKFKTALPDVYSHIYNKCLGLLNNIAEEKTCRSSLVSQQYMDFLITMLDQDDIQMTYFAGGILSNLLLISDEEWKGRCNQDKAFYENRIYVAVDSWVSPTYLMASYRSFCPFENLIANAGSSRAILLWALWAIRHTMKIERERYSSILRKHDTLVGYVELVALNHNPSYGRIRGLASDILLLLRQDGPDQEALYQMMVE